MSRNPNWTIDELILALDLYLRVNPLHTSENHPAIINLCELLNSLPIHPKKTKQQKFRNPSGVYMKLCNFLRFDPSYHGKDLTSGSKLEQLVWDNYENDRKKLSNTVKAIKTHYSTLSYPKTTFETKEYFDEDEEFIEGKILTRVHKRIERNSILVRKKKKSILIKTGRLKCEVCGFDFESVYGELGNGLIEYHHKKPISELGVEQKTKLSDLSMVCPNCHRMIHRSRPLLTISTLKNIFTEESEG